MTMPTWTDRVRALERVATTARATLRGDATPADLSAAVDLLDSVERNLAAIVNVRVIRWPHGANSRIQAIKEVREVFGLGLREAKDCIDKGPGVILSRVERAAGEDMLRRLTEHGIPAALDPHYARPDGTESTT